MFKGIIFALALVAITCHLHEELQTLEDEYVENFLQPMSESYGAPVKITNCDPKSPFKYTSVKVEPKSGIARGGDISIRVSGYVSGTLYFKKLHIDTYHNGNMIYNSAKEMNQEVTDKKWYYDHSESIPTFVPEGKWRIQLILKGKNNESLSCVEATFEIKSD